MDDWLRKQARADAPASAVGAVRRGRFVDDYLAYLLAAASEAVSRRFHRVVRKAGLKVPEWRILACLTDIDGLMVTELAKLTLLEQSRVTKTINGMEANGLVQRAPDSDDRRKVRILITERGRETVDPLIAIAKADEAALLAGLGADQTQRLKAALRRLSDEGNPPRRKLAAALARQSEEIKV